MENKSTVQDKFSETKSYLIQFCFSSKCIYLYIFLESETTSQFKNDLHPPENQPVNLHLEK